MTIMAAADLFISIKIAALCRGAACLCLNDTPTRSPVQHNSTPAYPQQAVVNPGAITVGVYTPPHTNPVQGQMAACK